MVQDTPMGFAESYETALTHGEATWRERGARGTGPDTAAFAAIAEDGRWIGFMGGMLHEGMATLIGVYVTPDYRGDIGVADALLAAVEHWAAQRGESLRLHVHENNDRARRYYEKRGFTATGREFPYILNNDELEHEMVKNLAVSVKP